MEIYRTLGLENLVRAAGSTLVDSRYMLFVDTLAGQEIRRVRDDDLVPVGEALAEVTPCGWCQCAQDGVTAELVDWASGERRTVRADYLVAADGAHSTVRQTLNVRMAGLGPVPRGPLGRFVNIYFRAELGDLVRGREFVLCFVEHPGAEGLFLAVNNTDRWLFNAEYRPDEGQTLAEFTPERCVALVRAAVGLPDLDVELLSTLPWEGAALVADNFRVGRVFLAGDAAHIAPPSGGSGLNTGVQDAHNLAWKLTAVVRGEADPALLGTYEAERRPVAQVVVDRAVREFDAPTPDAPVGPAGPDAGDWNDAGGGWGDGDGPPWGGEEYDPIEQLVPILGYSYASQAVAVEDGDHEVQAAPSGLDLSGRPGTRAPHVWLEHKQQCISTIDLCADRFVLLAGPEGAAWRDAARTLAERMNVDLDAYLVRTEGDLVDRHRQWSAAYGVTLAGAVLIRPDGFVGWRSVESVVSPTTALQHVLDRFLCRAA
jgi:putative polyketide hydroxylase